MSLDSFLEILKQLIKKKPDYFVLLSIILALLYPVYKGVLNLQPWHYLIIIGSTLLISLIWLFAIKLIEEKNQNREIILKNQDSLEGISSRLTNLNNLQDSLEGISSRLMNLNNLMDQEIQRLHPPIKLIKLERRESTRYFTNLLKESEKIDIIAFTGESFTRTIENNLKLKKEFKDKIIHKRCRIRILLLEFSTVNNREIYWKHRSIADNRTLQLFETIIKNVASYWKNFAQEIKEECKDNRNLIQGEITIKYYFHIPCYAYFRANSTSSVGLYLNFKTGKESPNIEITEEENNELYSYFKEDFRVLWDRSDNILIRITGDEIYIKED